MLIYYAATIALCAVVAGVVLLVRHIRGASSAERTRSTLIIAGVVALLFIDIFSLDDLFERTKAPLWSWLPIIVSIVIMSAFCIVANGKIREYDKEYGSKPSSVVVPVVAVVVVLALILSGPGGEQREKEARNDGYDEGYDDGFRDGADMERLENDAEWSMFFEDAQLKNTITGEPIESRDDFQKWRVDYAEAKAALKK